MQLCLDDVENDPFKRTRRGQEHRLADLFGELLHHRTCGRHQTFTQPFLGAAPERDQPYPQRHRAVRTPLDEAVLLELGQQPVGGAGRHARVTGELGHGQVGGLVAARHGIRVSSHAVAAGNAIFPRSPPKL